MAVIIPSVWRLPTNKKGGKVLTEHRVNLLLAFALDFDCLWE